MVEVVKREELMEHGAYYVVGYHHRGLSPQDDEEISFLSDPTGLNTLPRRLMPSIEVEGK
jgi:hypothetical protein